MTWIIIDFFGFFFTYFLFRNYYDRLDWTYARTRAYFAAFIWPIALVFYAIGFIVEEYHSRRNHA